MELVTDIHRRDEMTPALEGGRTFRFDRRPLLADCAPSGRARLDALARWMQDVAYADVEDAGLERVAVWVLRRHRIQVSRFPRFGERCVVSTFCCGIGRMWAQRRTTVTVAEPDSEAVSEPGSARPLVEATALWVHLDPERRLPSAVTEAERAVYASSVGNRNVTARLRHPRPEQVTGEWRWRFHHTDADIADHVNNAAYWEPFEDELLAAPHEFAELDVELEFRSPAQPGPVRILAGRDRRWIVAPESEDVYASLVVLHARERDG